MPKRNHPFSFSYGPLNWVVMKSLSRLLHPRMVHYMAIPSEVFSKQNKKKIGYDKASKRLRDEIKNQLPQDIPPGIFMANLGVRLSLLLTRQEAEKDVDNIAKWVIDIFSEAINAKYEIDFDDSQIIELVILKDRDSTSTGTRLGASPPAPNMIGIAFGYPNDEWQFAALTIDLKPTTNEKEICAHMNTLSREELFKWIHWERVEFR